MATKALGKYFLKDPINFSLKSHSFNLQEKICPYPLCPSYRQFARLFAILLIGECNEKNLLGNLSLERLCFWSKKNLCDKIALMIYKFQNSLEMKAQRHTEITNLSST